MTFDPYKDRGYNGRNDRKDSAATDDGELPRINPFLQDDNGTPPKAETPAQRYERMRADYNAALKRRVSTGSLESETITWTPTDRNRDRAFELDGRKIVVQALHSLSYDDQELLERFVGNAQAMGALLQYGKMPAGLTDHWKHPIRGGGAQTVDNVCIMTVEAQAKLRELRIYPAINHAYGNLWQETKDYLHRRGLDTGTRILQLERYAMIYKAESGLRRLPSKFSRAIEIGYPQDKLILSEVDFDLRDEKAALEQQADLNELARQRQPNRDRRTNHRPAAPHARQARRHSGPRR